MWLIPFIPNFAMEMTSRRKTTARKNAAKFWDYLGKYKKISSRFHLPTLRADFVVATTKSGFIIFSLLFNGCCSQCKDKPVVYTQQAMSTIVEISLWENGEMAEAGFSEIYRIENKFSRFKEESEISKINKDPSSNVSSECNYLIQESRKYFDITDGAFDINYSPDKKYDLGGIAKGYAADRVAEILRQKGITRALVNIGGNLYLLGMPPGKNFWDVGIKDPLQPDKLAGKIKLAGECGVSTSGSYERPRHIINSKTGNPADELLGVTITAPSAMEADALSTGVFVLGKKKGIELIEKLPDVEGVIIDKDGIWVSSGLKDKFETG